MQEMQETHFLSLDQKDLIEEKMATHSTSYLENPMNRGAWRASVHEDAESDMTERLTYTHTDTHTG